MMIRKRRWQESPVTGESTKETVKTIARGMPGETGVTVVTTLVCSFYFACEAAGASCARHSLRPRCSRVAVINSGALASRESELVSPAFLRPILRDAAFRPLLRMRSSHVARSQTLMVRRRLAPSRTMRPLKGWQLF